MNFRDELEYLLKMCPYEEWILDVLDDLQHYEVIIKKLGMDFMPIHDWARKVELQTIAVEFMIKYKVDTTIAVPVK
jgi:hypothetical protein